MPLADPRRRRNPVATSLRDAVVVLAVLAIGTTVQISFERLPGSHGDGARMSSAPHARPADVDMDRWTLDPEDAVAPVESERERHRSAIRADRAESNAGPAADRGVNVEIPAIATHALRLVSVERP
jgi:creatinine amidohydrolase/Fe(II)-dependent formamide hydrolase-like protein